MPMWILRVFWSHTQRTAKNEATAVQYEMLSNLVVFKAKLAVAIKGESVKDETELAPAT